MKIIQLLLSMLLILPMINMGSLQAQAQNEIIVNSDGSADKPHLLLTEDDTQLNDGPKIWMKINSDPNDNRWTLTARPKTGATDGSGLVSSPFAFGYNGSQKLAISSDGELRINNTYMLPNVDGSDGTTLLSNGSGIVDWNFIDYTEKTSTFPDPTLLLHDNSNGSAKLLFSNNQFADNRFYISGDPSNTTGVNASMKFGWGNVNTGVFSTIMQLDGATDNVGIGVDPYEDFRLHVEGTEAAAHFGPQSSVFPAVGYVTVNQPASNASTVIFKVRHDGATKVDIDVDESTFFTETVFRDNVELVNADLDLIGGSGGSISAKDAVFSGAVTASCGVLSCSDIRYKKNITTIPSAIDKLNQIEGVYYHWDTENFKEFDFNDKRQVGIIAQDVEEVFPELVHTKEDGYKVVAYDKMGPILLQAIKEQQEMIEALQKSNEKLVRKVEELSRD